MALEPLNHNDQRIINHQHCQSITEIQPPLTSTYGHFPTACTVPSTTVIFLTVLWLSLLSYLSACLFAQLPPPSIPISHFTNLSVEQATNPPAPALKATLKAQYSSNIFTIAIEYIKNLYNLVVTTKFCTINVILMKSFYSIQKERWQLCTKIKER